MTEEFDPNAAGLIMLGRIYDVLTIIAHGIDPGATAKMREAHEAGILIGPEPSYVEENN